MIGAHVWLFKAAAAAGLLKRPFAFVHLNGVCPSHLGAVKLSHCLPFYHQTDDQHRKHAEVY